MKKLDAQPARKLTEVQCQKILGGMIAGLMQIADMETVRAAVLWWADCDAGWQFMESQNEAIQKQTTQLAEDFLKSRKP